MICALCTAAIVGDAFTREPLGKNDALVVVCPDCSSAPIIARRGPDHAYEPNGGLLSTSDVAHLRTSRKVKPYVPAFVRKPNTRIARLSIRRDGKARDAAEAVLDDLPMLADDLRYLGASSNGGWHLYETTASDVEIRRAKARADRERRSAAGKCINHENRKATHGCRCFACHETHRKSA